MYEGEKSVQYIYTHLGGASLGRVKGQQEEEDAGEPGRYTPPRSCSKGGTAVCSSLHHACRVLLPQPCGFTWVKRPVVVVVWWWCFPLVLASR